jgi:hypothetical protein
MTASSSAAATPTLQPSYKASNQNEDIVGLSGENNASSFPSLTPTSITTLIPTNQGTSAYPSSLPTVEMPTSTPTFYLAPPYKIGRLRAVAVAGMVLGILVVISGTIITYSYWRRVRRKRAVRDVLSQVEVTEVENPLDPLNYKD